MLEWHFSFTGVKGSPYEEGLYHGKIKLHTDYPRSAPTICMYTPSGRWQVKADICLSASAHHPESWNPNWNLRTLVLSLRGFMTTQPGEIGSISSTVQRQRELAQLSTGYVCPECGICHTKLLKVKPVRPRLTPSHSSNGTGRKQNVYLPGSSVSSIRRKVSLLTGRRGCHSSTSLLDNGRDNSLFKRKVLSHQRGKFGQHLRNNAIVCNWLVSMVTHYAVIPTLFSCFIATLAIINLFLTV